MTLAATENYSGGFVRDADERPVFGIATGAGKGLTFVSISTAASGQTALVSAVTGQKIKVVSYTVVASAAVTVQFQSGSTALTGAMALAANGGVSASGNHLFETAVNTALNINLGSAVQVSGHLAYYTE